LLHPGGIYLSSTHAAGQLQPALVTDVETNLLNHASLVRQDVCNRTMLMKMSVVVAVTCCRSGAGGIYLPSTNAAGQLQPALVTDVDLCGRMFVKLMVTMSCSGYRRHPCRMLTVSLTANGWHFAPILNQAACLGRKGHT
jgi:hypothetical protein